MNSDESGHSEREFPEEETLNQMTPINLFPNFKRKKSKKNHYVIYRARSVRMGKTVPFVLSTGRSYGSSFFRSARSVTCSKDLELD